MLLVTSRARAYIYSGDWVADCPREGCGNVEYLCDQENPLNPASPRTRRRSQFLCSNCKYFTSDIEWPANGAELMEVLAVRPIPGTRNWYPRDHSVAVRAGYRMGRVWPIYAMRTPSMGFPDVMRNVAVRSLVASAVLATPLAAVTGEARSLTATTSVVFQAGVGGYDLYRIPAIIRTPSGVLMAFAEGRHTTSDTGNVDIVARRSFDGGATWLAQRVVTSHGTDTAGNPAVVVDPASGDIVLLSCRNGATVTEAQIMQGKATSTTTRRVYVQRSADVGVTWSAPTEISESTIKAGWRWYATGPGHGVAKAAEPHAGRLIIPANHSASPTGTDTGSEAKYYGAQALISDDGGLAWRIGFTSSTPNGYINENESTVAELPTGQLYFSARDQNGTGPGNRADAISIDGGETLQAAYRPQATITTPVVEGSVIALPDGRLLYSGPSHPTDRAAMALRVSEDAGRTWTVGYQVSGLPAAYSDMVVIEDTVGLLYETGDWGANDTVTFTRIPIAEIGG